MKKIIWIASFCFSMVSMLNAQVEPPVNVKVNGYERHNMVRWDASPSANIVGYRVYRSKKTMAQLISLSALLTPMSAGFLITWVP